MRATRGSICECQDTPGSWTLGCDIGCKCRCHNLEAENARLREALELAKSALEHCKHRPHEHNPGADFVVTRCEVIDRALAALSGDKP